MNKLNVASKILGGVSAVLVGYNAHQTGKRVSAENVKLASSDRTWTLYNNSRKLDDRSIVKSAAKDWYFRTNADWTLPDKMNSITGYFKGAFQQLASDIVPAALATGALLSKKMSKFFGLGLLIYGAKVLLFDVIDIGRHNNLKF